MARKIGLIKGLSFESEAAYAGLESDKVLTRSLDRGDVWETFLDSGWPGVGELALEAALSLKEAGANLLALAGCAGHKVAAQIEAGAGLPLFHIADPLGEEAARLELTSLGLVGARFTLSDGHLRDRLKDRYGLRVLVPEPADIETVQSIIHEELLKGRVEDESRAELVRIMGVLQDSGAQALVLVFADLNRLAGPGESPLPLLETSALHAAALARAAGL